MLVTQVLWPRLARALLVGLRPDQVRIRAAYVLKVVGVAGPACSRWSPSAVVDPVLRPAGGPRHAGPRRMFRHRRRRPRAGTSLQAVAPAGLTAIHRPFGGSQYEAGRSSVYRADPPGARPWCAGGGYGRSGGVDVLRCWPAPSRSGHVHLGGITTGIPAGLLAVAFLRWAARGSDGDAHGLRARLGRAGDRAAAATMSCPAA